MSFAALPPQTQQLVLKAVLEGRDVQLDPQNTAILVEARLASAGITAPDPAILDAAVDEIVSYWSTPAFAQPGKLLLTFLQQGQAKHRSLDELPLPLRNHQASQFLKLPPKIQMLLVETDLSKAEQYDPEQLHAEVAQILQQQGLGYNQATLAAAAEELADYPKHVLEAWVLNQP